MTNANQKPKCIAFIMDGNRRWAKKNGKNVVDGHTAGYNKLKEVVTWTKDAGIKDIIVYAFSTENWNRAKEEVGALMKLLEYVLSNKIDELIKEGLKLKFIGDIDRFSPNLLDLIEKPETRSLDNNGCNLTIALSYGGRAEILHAVKAISKLEKGKINSLTENDISDFLWTKGIPDPDIIVRTGGEIRLSNFLPYQSIYSEFFFSKTLWPDFSKEEFDSILEEYSKRKINHGK